MGSRCYLMVNVSKNILNGCKLVKDVIWRNIIVGLFVDI